MVDISHLCLLLQLTSPYYMFPTNDMTRTFCIGCRSQAWAQPGKYRQSSTGNCFGSSLSPFAGAMQSIPSIRPHASFTSIEDWRADIFVACIVTLPAYVIHISTTGILRNIAFSIMFACQVFIAGRTLVHIAQACPRILKAS
jgi:hypothetical protein